MNEADEKIREANRQRQKRFLDQHREEVNRKRRERYSERLSKGKCARCGAKAKKGFSLCQNCSDYMKETNKISALNRKERTAKESPVKKPAVKKPAAKKPAVKKPVVKKTVTKNTAAKKPAAGAKKGKRAAKV